MVVDLPLGGWAALGLLAVFAVVETVALARAGRRGKRQELASMLAIGSCSIIWAASLAEGVFSGGWLPAFTGWFGAAIFALGVGLRAASFSQLGRFYNPAVTLHDDHQLITTGIYKHARHPLYAGSLCLFLGFPLAFSSAVGLGLFLVLAVPVFAWRIRVEERALASHFGPAWEEYRSRTPALFI
ncbi:isoprenylcysteine carboxylmethyltransferase family protein [Myxococcota bacterium]|nr:isoprenylcysteine carboxylmethyltransferase family protein [Myxococcota bacterium]